MRCDVSRQLAVFLAVVFIGNFPGSVNARSLAVKATSEKSPHAATLRLKGPVNPDDKKWVKEQLREGRVLEGNLAPLPTIIGIPQ
jgi:hypothetical protein